MATTDKYDRQLRLWGASGQKALAGCCVVLVGATAAGTETLKNLVLPGVGAFGIIDDRANVTATDAAVNFFATTTTTSSGSRSHTSVPGADDENENENETFTRAATTAKLLQELNPDVRSAHATVQDLATIDVDHWEGVLNKVIPQNGNNNITNNNNNNNGKRDQDQQQAMDTTTGDWQVFVVASDLTPTVLKSLSTYCQRKGYALLIVQSYGLIGTVRLQAPPLPIMDPKPRSHKPDLRIGNPFSALRSYFEQMSKRLTQFDSRELRHVPYPVLLWHFLERYKTAHGGRVPETLAEKQEFAKSIRAAATNYNDQINFQEAFSNAYLAYATTSSSSSSSSSPVDVTHLTDLLKRANPESDFAVLLRAMQAFLQTHDQQPPLHGSIPDMTASTTNYVMLQQLYRQQAEMDLKDFAALVNEINSSSNTSSNTSSNSSDNNYKHRNISMDRITTFCQNAVHLDLVATRTWTEEYSHQTVPEHIKEELAMALMEVDTEEEHGELLLQMTPLWWYLGIRACQAFWERNGRYPGALTSEDESTILKQDADTVQAEFVKLLQHYGIDQYAGALPPLLAAEMTRYGAAEIHTVASVVGGVASQEAVKVITGQYTPLRGAYVYNGIASTGGMYQF